MACGLIKWSLCTFDGEDALQLLVEVYKSNEQAAGIIARDGQIGEALSRAEVQRAFAYLL